MDRGKVKVDVSFSPMAEVQEDCRTWAREIAAVFNPDAIVFLEKSGFLFAKPMAEEFGCPMYSIAVSRPGNDAKDGIRKIVPWVPRPLLAAVLSSKAAYAYADDNSRRAVKTNPAFDRAPLEDAARILIVDDSIDTGWSILAASEVVRRRASEADIRIAGYCALDYSGDRVGVDFIRKSNAIVVTATSRYSKEHAMFLSELEAWKRSSGGC